MWHPSSTIEGIVHSEDGYGHEAFWRGGQLLVADEAANHPALVAELRQFPYEVACGIRRYRLPEHETEEVLIRLTAASDLEGLVSVNHLFAAQHRPPWWDHPHETYHFANYEHPRISGVWNPPPGADLGEAAVTVAILDTGLSNPWLEGHAQIVDITTDSPETTEDARGHGDLVASAILGGVPRARLVVAPLMSWGGLIEEFDVIRAFELDVIRSSNVVVMAFAGYTEDNQPPAALARVLLQGGAEQVVVAAAGNGGDSRIRWPAGLSSVVAVGALDHEGRPWPHSDFGDWVDVMAPGVGITGAYSDGGESAIWTGTSAAAAVAAGQVANAIGQGLSPGLAVAELRRASPA